jgi:hypothetical protein
MFGAIRYKRRDMANKPPREKVAFRDRATCSVREAVQAIPCGKTKLYEWIKLGKITTLKFGSRRLVVISSLLGMPSAEKD